MLHLPLRIPQRRAVLAHHIEVPEETREEDAHLHNCKASTRQTSFYRQNTHIDNSFLPNTVPQPKREQLRSLLDLTSVLRISPALRYERVRINEVRRIMASRPCAKAHSRPAWYESSVDGVAARWHNAWRTSWNEWVYPKDHGDAGVEVRHALDVSEVDVFFRAESGADLGDEEVVATWVPD
jgi:hypothetical protein